MESPKTKMAELIRKHEGENDKNKHTKDLQ
jgi:hypothetical protein